MKTAMHVVDHGSAEDRELAAEALEQLAELQSGKHTVEVGGVKIKLTNVDKVMYPATGFTKLDLARYYASVAPVLLPHLRGRALTLKRYPDGVDGEFFYQKRCPQHRPDWVRTAAVWSEGNDADVDYCLPEDVQTLIWAANLADIELHVLLSLAENRLRPTVMAFDLDPGEGVDVIACCEVALHLRTMFEDFGLRCFPKTSGSKGLQVYVPLNDPDVTFDDTKSFSRAVAQLLERQHPDLVVHKMLKTLRRGKVLVDWSQNDDHKTTVSVYSLRAKQQPTASTPLRWEEVEQAASTGDAASLAFEWHEVLDRVDEHGDLFHPVLALHQQLPKLG